MDEKDFQPPENETPIASLAEFEALKKEKGYGCLTYDRLGTVAGVAYIPPEFDYYQDLFKDAEVIGVTPDDGIRPILTIKYRQNGEEKVMFTSSRTLLAALMYILETFYKEARTLSGSLSGWDKDQKTPC